jgi:hypothetical protein
MGTISLPTSKQKAEKEMSSEFYIPESSLVLNEAQRTVTVEVVFGMPAKDCLYHGICKIEPATTPHNAEKPAKGTNGQAKPSTLTKAEVSATSTGQLVFRFHKDDMLRGKASRHFGSGYFIVLEDIRTPAWMNEALDIHGYNISTGIYKVNEGKAWYEVAFS